MTTVINRYLTNIEQNMLLWNEIMPTKINPRTNFFNDKNTDKEALNYSLGVLWDMIGRKGKKIRPILMLLLADIHKISHEHSLPLSYLVETVHNSTLIIDDIEDNSLSRRGEPCCHIKFGVDNSINAGALGYFLPIHNMLSLEPFENLDSQKKFELLSIYLEEMKNIHLGLAWDIYWHGRKYTPESLPTEENYYMMVESKTSVLLRIGFRMLANVNNLPQEERLKHIKLANLVGASFQIQDDLINLTSESYSTSRGVGVGEDITEGKITLMVIEHIKRTKDKSLLDLLHAKPTDQKLIDGAIQSMKESGALDYADRTQRQTMQQAIELVRGLNGEKRYKDDFEVVLDGLLGRSK